MAKKIVAEPEEKKETKKEFTYAVGKRKESRARVRVYDVKELPFGEEVIKKGEVIVNGKKIGEYFSGMIAQAYYLEPFKITNTEGRYIFTIKTSGGGMNGQLKAVVHGISRALAGMDLENRKLLKKAGLLTRDARVRERRKVGMGGKARRRKQSPKR